MAYAKGTTVTTDRSRAELERTLTRYGAHRFSYGTEPDGARIMFEAAGRVVRFDIPFPSIVEFTRSPGGVTRTVAQREKARDQAIRERWRALLLVVKAKLEAIASGIETFDDAFMPHIVLPDGKTAGEWLSPQIAVVYETGEMPLTLPGARPQLEQAH